MSVFGSFEPFCIVLRPLLLALWGNNYAHVILTAELWLGGMPFEQKQ